MARRIIVTEAELASILYEANKRFAFHCAEQIEQMTMRIEGDAAAGAEHDPERLAVGRAVLRMCAAFLRDIGTAGGEHVLACPEDAIIDDEAPTHPGRPLS